jgi:hypothetical protein
MPPFGRLQEKGNGRAEFVENSERNTDSSERMAESALALLLPSPLGGEGQA